MENKYILFTKSNCKKCQNVKELILFKGILYKVEIRVYVPKSCTMQNVEILAEMAFYEIVATSEKLMPILVEKTGDGFVVHAGEIKTKRRLEEPCNQK